MMQLTGDKSRAFLLFSRCNVVENLSCIEKRFKHYKLRVNNCVHKSDQMK